MPPGERIEALPDWRLAEPDVHRLRAQLQEDAFTTVFHCREPPWFQSELGALHIRLVFPLDVRCHRLEAREANERQNLAQAMELDYSLDPFIAFRAAPSSLGQTACVEVRIHWDVVAESLRCGKQRIELHLFQGPLCCLAALARSDRGQHLVITK